MFGPWPSGKAATARPRASEKAKKTTEEGRMDENHEMQHPGTYSAIAIAETNCISMEVVDIVYSTPTIGGTNLAVGLVDITFGSGGRMDAVFALATKIETAAAGHQKCSGGSSQRVQRKRRPAYSNSAIF